MQLSKIQVKKVNQYKTEIFKEKCLLKTLQFAYNKVALLKIILSFKNGENNVKRVM